MTSAALEKDKKIKRKGMCTDSITRIIRKYRTGRCIFTHSCTGNFVIIPYSTILKLSHNKVGQIMRCSNNFFPCQIEMWKLAILLLAAVAFASERPLTHRVGAVRQCVQNHLYELAYDVDSLHDSQFITLESVTGLTAMQCDIDSTHFLMDFDTTAHMAAFISATPPFNTFVTRFVRLRLVCYFLTLFLITQQRQVC